jgi:hypothetical protein
MPARKIPVETRFWAKVQKTEDCWLWVGSVDGSDYGHIKIEGKMVKAHRVAYEMLVAPIEDGLEIDHLCRTRRCVNPGHLEPVTKTENARRGVGQPARHGRQTHCKRGHEFTPENTYQWQTSRICRTCRSEYSKKWMALTR